MSRKYNTYFPHDSTAKDDPKCVLLIEQLGLEAYGIYWVLVETLREQPSYRYPMNLIPALARRYNTTSEKVKAVVCSYGLFQVENDEFFFSQSLIERMQPLEAKRLSASKAGKASAEKRKLNGCSTSVQQTFNECSTSKVKESKVNEISNKLDNKESTNVPKKKLSLTDRQENFKNSLVPHVEKYGRELIRAFFDYWSEPNTANTKMRFELQRTWDIAGRLRTWERRANEKR